MPFSFGPGLVSKNSGNGFNKSVPFQERRWFLPSFLFWTLFCWDRKSGRLFTRTALKLIRVMSHISFVTTCLKFNLRPAFVAFRISFTSSTRRKRLKHWLNRKWLNSEWRSWYFKKAVSQDLLHCASTRLASLLPPEDFQLLLTRNHRRQCKFHAILYNLKLNKLRCLSASVQQSTIAEQSPFADPVINLSCHTFTHDETKLGLR